ncbi:MAG TPA: MlaD family protein [Gemmatimonadaceae bacterium]|jgi:ABC-type transporter Mla subunit MlaD
MPHQLHWRELTGGLIAVGVIAALVLVVLVFARVGALHGKKVTLYVVTDEAPGVLKGTEVWLAGEQEGQVKDVSFLPPKVDVSERVLITTEFLKEAMPSVRRDSYAQIRPGGRLIGTPIVYISPGTTASPPLKDGDTIHARQKAAIADLGEDISTVGPEFAALGAATGELANKIDRAVGTLGKARASGFEDAVDIKAGVISLNARVTAGRGTIGSITRSSLAKRATQTMAAADSIRSLASSKKGNIGRFRRDSTLVTKARHVLAELDTLRALVNSPVGTIAAVHSDSVLARQLERQHTLLAELIKDIKANPMRYIRF